MKMRSNVSETFGSYIRRLRIKNEEDSLYTVVNSKEFMGWLNENM